MCWWWQFLFLTLTLRLDVKNELPEGNYLGYLIQPEIKRQRKFELTDIESYQIKNEIKRMECVDYNTSIGWNVMNEDDI